MMNPNQRLQILDPWNSPAPSSPAIQDPFARSFPREWEAFQARERLVGILQGAYSGELGAIYAYQGHRRSVNRPEEQERIHQIELEETCHRELVGQMLSHLGAAPDPKLDRKMGLIGKTISGLCQVGGWFVPMYGAGFLESQNIQEYADAAQCARLAGHSELLDDLLTMAEVEWEHENYFRQQCRSHFLYSAFPKWDVPPEKERIRMLYDLKDYPEGGLKELCLTMGL